jgi:hypothetical protein
VDDVEGGDDRDLQPRLQRGLLQRVDFLTPTMSSTEPTVPASASLSSTVPGVPFGPCGPDISS